MSWTLLQQATYSSAPDYSRRIQMAFLKTAQDVVSEGSGAAHHEERLALANQVINGSGIPIRAVPILHVLNPALQVDGGEPTDNDLLFTVSQQWNYFAGV